MRYHQPVMVQEVVALLVTRPEGIYVDGTLGDGGHAEAILQHLTPEGRLIGIDWDAQALKVACERLFPYQKQFRALRGNFQEIPQLLSSVGVDEVNGVLLDLGVSLRQLQEAERGFSFQRDGPLDMRMDQERERSAFQVVNEYSERELVRIFRQYGEERRASRIARAIVRARRRGIIQTTGQLVKIIRSVIPGVYAHKTLARIFQAIRIEVNEELDNLKAALDGILDVLTPGGRVAVISYHSLEDRIVKQWMKRHSGLCLCPPELPECQCGRVGRLKMVTRKAVVPSPGEKETNPNSRSAKLRVAEKVLSPE